MTEHGNMAHFNCEKCKVKCLTKEEMENHVTREHIKDNNSGLDLDEKEGRDDAQNSTMCFTTGKYVCTIHVGIQWFNDTGKVTFSFSQSENVG